MLRAFGSAGVSWKGVPEHPQRYEQECVHLIALSRICAHRPGFPGRFRCGKNQSPFRW